jgi:thiosulfate/3-mercaptopyruvate sulfurtransferase
MIRPVADEPGGAAMVSTAELSRRLGEPGLRVVDLRPLAEYNGWRARDAARGGHVPGAVAFPAGWLSRLGDAKLQSLLEGKGIATSGEVVVYGDVGAASAFRSWLVGHATVPVRTYAAGWSGWSADASLPVEWLANYQRLVPPGWLRKLLDGDRPEAAPRRRFLVLHVNFGVPEEYADGHLPGALHLDTNQLESPPDWNRRPPDELDAAVRTLGITRDTTVILYGRDAEGGADKKWPGRRAGQLAATRAALILSYCGVDDVRLLDGGYDAWVQAGHPLEAVPRLPAPVPTFGAVIPARPELIVDLEEARQILADREGAALVSVRSWDEHVGKVSGYSYIGQAGRIAGDVWGNSGSDAYHMQHYRNLDNTMRPYPEIASSWKQAGITPDKRVAFYCGTGWRASQAWFYGNLMGWPRVAVYDGGWSEWSRNPDKNPIAVGAPEEPDAGRSTVT